MKRLLPFLLLLFCSQAHATITRAVSSVGVFNTNANTVTATISCAAGNLATVFAALRNSTATLVISDSTSGSNTWTGFSAGLTNQQFGAHSETEWVGYSVVASSLTSVTVSNTITIGIYLSVGCYHSTNGWPADPRDRSAGPNQTNGGMAFTSGATSTLSQASEVAVGGGLFVFDPGTITPANSFVTQTNTTYDSGNAALEYTADKILNATTAVTYSGTTANNSDVGNFVVTYKDNAASGTKRLRGSVISQ